MVFDFNAHINHQVDMIQVFASKECCLGDFLPKTLYKSYTFSAFAKFLRDKCGQMSQSVSYSVSE